MSSGARRRPRAIAARDHRLHGLRAAKRAARPSGFSTFGRLLDDGLGLREFRDCRPAVPARSPNHGSDGIFGIEIASDGMFSFGACVRTLVYA